MESSKPDVQFGKIFIVLWIGFMLFIVISIVVVYFNAKKETSSCEASVMNVEKSKESSMGRTPKLFIAFLAITAFAVSTMNLTYKINYLTKKPLGPSAPPMNNESFGPSAPPMNNESLGPSAPPMNHESLGPSAPPMNHESLGPSAPPMNHESFGPSAPPMNH